MNGAVERAAGFIWEKYSEQLSLADIAGSASLSRFHLCRIFQAATRISPFRFLAAVRVHQAKHLLLTTSVSIADISFAVGYNSVGSFTNYFTSSVGMSPRRFRQVAGAESCGFPCPAGGAAGGQTLGGTVSLPAGYAGARVYLGAFTTTVVQYRPAAAVVIEIPDDGRPVPFRLPGVPRGTWFVHAVGLADGADPPPWTRRVALVGTHDPVPVTAGATARVTVPLRPRRITDPPVLLALPGLVAGTAGPAAGPVPAAAGTVMT